MKNFFVVILLFIALQKVLNAAEAEPKAVDEENKWLLLEKIREMSRWDRYVHGFRDEHNFAYSLGNVKGTWNFRRLGTVADKIAEEHGAYAKFQYSFHLPIIGSFGGILGSSTGYVYETRADRTVYAPIREVCLPGLVAGMVYNFTAGLRLSAAGEIYMERVDGLHETDGVEPDRKISVTLEALEYQVAFDIFVHLKWAVRLEYHNRQVYFFRPIKSENYPVNAKFSKTDRFIGIGMLYHRL